MIAKDTTTIVRFYATTSDGLPATGKTITAAISIDGGNAETIAETISESDPINLPGWYEFEYTFDVAGNAFIIFSCTGCTIMPWEEDIVEVSGSSAPSAATVANAVWNWTVTGIPSQNSMYSKVTGIPASVWGNGTRSLTTEVISVNKSLATDISPSSIAAAVWSDTANYLNQSSKGYLQTSGGNVWEQVASHDPITGTDTTYGTVLKSRASGSEVISAKTAIINAMPDVSGLSTFDPTQDTVTINATQAATMVTATGFATPSDIPTDYAKSSELPDVSGLATSTNVSDAQSAIIRAMPSIPTDYAKASDIPDISGLSTFDPAKDTVVLNNAQAATMATATGFATPANVTAAQTAIINAIPPIPSDYAKSTDIPDISDLATATDVTTAQAAIIDHGDSNWTGGGSGGGATPQQIWEYENRTLTASPTDVSALATASDLANSTSTLQTLLTNILAGLYHWRVKNNVLTIYNDSDAIIATFSITRDPTGNIIAVTPINN